MKIVFCVPHKFALWRVPEWLPLRLRREFPAVEVVNLSAYDQLEDQVADADVLVTWSLRPGQLASARRLRWLHSTMAGVNGVLIPEVVERNIKLTNSSRVHGATVAEHALATLLALAKQLPRARDFQHESRWSLDRLMNEGTRPRTVHGAVLTIIGLGAIGGRLARIASAIGMRVYGVREHPSRGGEGTEKKVVSFEQMEQVLRVADFVVLAAPVTEKTLGLMNADRLATLKRDAYLINVSRGALLDEAALVDAIREKRLAGAALDVFAEEPLPDKSPLWKVPEILITPHAAAFNENLWQLQYDLFSENLRRFQAGKTLLGEVDKRRGY